MTKSNRRMTSISSRKSPSRKVAAKSVRRSSLKSKTSTAIGTKARKAAPRARRLVSRVKRTVASALAR